MMKKKVLLVLVALLMMGQSVFAYDFSAVAPTGQTLYYNIVDGHAEIVRPGTGSTYNNYVSGHLEIPSMVIYNGANYSVTKLATTNNWGAFEHCTNLLSIIIPNSVICIDILSFAYCSNLANVTIGNSVDSIYAGTFYGCNSLTCINFPDTSSLSNWCNVSFNGSDSRPPYGFSIAIGGNIISNLTIPSTVTSVGDSVFGGCTGLASVTIPNSVTSIGDAAFRWCSNLASVSFPQSLTSIGSYAFFIVAI